ncbi:hypothetical protein HDU81_007410 [Chytriomyces hyalinus]|nr:hypothetical protein HDU81_007410 [Chytriomyces hyalinus]
MAMALYSRSPLMASSPSRDLEHFAGLTDAFCKDFVCCGINMDNLHDLLQHFEEYHVALNDDIDSDSDLEDTNADPLDSRHTSLWDSYGRNRNFSDTNSNSNMSNGGNTSLGNAPNRNSSMRSDSSVVEEYHDSHLHLPFAFESHLSGPSSSTDHANSMNGPTIHLSKPGSYSNSLSFASRGRSFFNNGPSSSFSAMLGGNSHRDSTRMEDMDSNDQTHSSNSSSNASISNMLSTSLGALSMTAPCRPEPSTATAFAPTSPSDLFMRGMGSPSFTFEAFASRPFPQSSPTGSGVSAQAAGGNIPSPSNSIHCSTPPPLHHELAVAAPSSSTSAARPVASSASSAVQPPAKKSVDAVKPGVAGDKQRRLNDALAGAVAVAETAHDQQQQQNQRQQQHGSLQAKKRKFVGCASGMVDSMDVDKKSATVVLQSGSTGMEMIGGREDEAFVAQKKRVTSGEELADEEEVLQQGHVSHQIAQEQQLTDFVVDHDHHGSEGLSALVSSSSSASTSPSLAHMVLNASALGLPATNSHFKKRSLMSSASFSPIETDAAISSQQQIIKFSELSSEAIEAFQQMTPQQQQDFIMNHLEPNQIALLMMLVNQASMGVVPEAALPGAVPATTTDGSSPAATTAATASTNQPAATPTAASTPAITLTTASPTVSTSAKPSASKGTGKGTSTPGGPKAAKVPKPAPLKPGRGNNGPRTKVTQKQTLKQLKEQHLLQQQLLQQQQQLQSGSTLETGVPSSAGSTATAAAGAPITQERTPAASTDASPSASVPPSDQDTENAAADPSKEGQEDDRPFKCHLCDKSYKNPGGIKYHLKHTHGIEHVSFSDMTDADRPYLCTVEGCGKRYKNLNGLKYHIEHAHVALLEGAAATVAAGAEPAGALSGEATVESSA